MCSQPTTTTMPSGAATSAAGGALPPPLPPRPRPPPPASSSSSSSSSSPSAPPTVAVIGCGPSGMFFLHALAARRSRLAAMGDAAGLASLPVATCYERASGPGGVWRSDRFRGEETGDGGENATNMYEALWTNGPKEAMEFFDYTYLEHFGRAMPTYLPRGLVLEYVLARCAKNDPGLFDDVRFDTSVTSVTYDEATKKFHLEISDGTTASFDYCVWAAGMNGKPKFPPSVDAALKAGGFQGVTMHSARTDDRFDEHVRDKNVVIVGDESSAEDLALQAIKLGVASVEVVSRAGGGPASITSSWPMDKVDANEEFVITGVAGEDGRDIVCSRVAYDFDEGRYAPVPGRQITLCDVDTVIYATGYEANFDMLEEGLRPDLELGFEDGNVEDGDVPLDAWKMSENRLTEDLGDVPPSEEICPEPGFVRPDMYRNRLISNPNMFFLFEEHTVPLFNLDILAWLVLAQMTGDLPLPSPEEMHRFNAETLFECMNDPIWRYESDDNYQRTYTETLDDDHWANDDTSAGSVALHRNHHNFAYRLLARDASDAGYPLDLGTSEALNDVGDALVELQVLEELCRVDMDDESPDAEWRTFRDRDPSEYRSVLTGTAAVPLKAHWLDIEGCEERDIVDGDPAAADEGVPVPFEEDIEGEEKKESGMDIDAGLAKVSSLEAPESPTTVCGEQ